MRSRRFGVRFGFRGIFGSFSFHRLAGLKQRFSWGIGLVGLAILKMLPFGPLHPDRPGGTTLTAAVRLSLNEGPKALEAPWLQSLRTTVSICHPRQILSLRSCYVMRQKQRESLTKARDLHSYCDSFTHGLFCCFFLSRLCCSQGSLFILSCRLACVSLCSKAALVVPWSWPRFRVMLGAP